MLPLLLVSACLGALNLAAEPDPGYGNLKGKVYELGGDRTVAPIYRYQRLEKKTGDRVEGVAKFVDPEGNDVASERIVIEKGRVVKYDVERKQVDEKGSVEIRGTKAVLTHVVGSKAESTEIDRVDNLVVGPSMLYYLKEHWGEILAGDEVHVRLIVVDRLDTFGFKFFKVGEEDRGGKPVIRLKMKPTSFFISALVEPVFLTVERDSFKLIEVSGRTLVKRRVKGDWQDVDADIVFDAWGDAAKTPL